ncbi:flagellar hook assembly protein FlgD [Chelativorans alearense]|uniref:flagellar hook assembly protein FlgD n=1 Tax=Chelativorans alearense TaxID=2681495 RepID=UPI0013D4BC96|nr:flagellar hook assembly protein FlgD [Chelativorans alearense]
MNVSTVTGTAQDQTSTAAPQAVDYQSFLKLLVAEMKNQDPTSPMESTDYVAQLASFSQVEQSVQINDKLEQILAASSLSQAGSLVGREITSADGTVTGIVSEVKLYSDGVVAKLEGGQEVIVGPGVVIR